MEAIASNVVQMTQRHYNKAIFSDLAGLFDPNFQYELRTGVIYKMSPSSMLPSTIAMRIGIYIGTYLLKNNIGHLTGADGAYELSDENTFAPDVGFISYQRQLEVIEQGFVPKAPDLAVEVVSPTDHVPAVRDKAETYLAAGTQLVWLVFPSTKTVDVYQPDADVSEKTVDDVLLGGTVLPSFELNVADIFPEN